MKVRIIPIILIWVYTIIGLLIWESSTDMIQGIIIGLVLTGASVASDGIIGLCEKLFGKQEKNYYIKF